MRRLFSLAVLPLSTLASLTTNLTTNTQWSECFEPPESGTIPAAVYGDCIRAILTWGNVPGRDRPITFSRDAAKGYKVPHTVTQGDCVFKIDMRIAESDAVSSMSEIAKLAGGLARTCVLKQPHLGGVAFGAAFLLIEITLHGRLISQNEAAIAGWNFIGCSTKVFPVSSHPDETNLTVEACAENCSGSRYFGVEAGTK